MGKKCRQKKMNKRNFDQITKYILQQTREKLKQGKKWAFGVVTYNVKHISRDKCGQSSARKCRGMT